MTADREWDVTSDPPTTLTAKDEQQAADERVRLELETPPGPADADDSAPLLYVRPAGTTRPWVKVHPVFPDMTPEDLR
jgi:hypothetical protein